MMISDTRPQNKHDTLTSLATMYPLAFTLAAASNSRAGLALRLWKVAGVNPPRSCVGESLESSLQQSTVG